MNNVKLQNVFVFLNFRNRGA